MNRSLLLVGLVLLGSSASAEVFTVDDDGGPGVDFTDLPPALAAAEPGDTILVRPGAYSASTVTEGVTIRGTAGTSATLVHSILVAGLPAKQVVLLLDMEIRAVTVEACAGTVVLSGVDALTSAEDLLQPLVVEGSRDVRVFGSALGRAMYTDDTTPVLPAVEVEGSRLEMVASVVSGQPGGESLTCDTYPGGPGLVLRAQGRAHLAAMPVVRGGSGGDQWDDCIFCGFSVTGDGAPGIRLEGAGELILTGTTGDHRVVGGSPGSNLYSGWYCDCTGDPAPAVEAGPGTQMLWSEVSFEPGVDPDCGGAAAPISGPNTQLPSISWLEVQPPAARGGAYRFVVRGEPGSSVELVLGATPIVAPTPGVEIERLVQADRRLPMGTIAPSGNVSKLVPLPWDASAGQVVFAQAELATSGGLERTNSQLVFVR